MKELRSIHKCSICQKSFTSSGNRLSHERRIHSGLAKTKNFTCECGKAFRCRTTLNNHKKIVHENKRIPCLHCEKQFTCSMSLTNHVALNHMTDCQKLPCEICGEMFPVGDLLRRHVSKHSKWFECTYEGCSRKFKNKFSLRYHTQSVHMPAKDAKCPTCGASFKTDLKLECHMKLIHSGRRADCQVTGCSYTSSRRHHLRNHYEKHEGINEATRQSLLEQLENIKKTKLKQLVP